MEEVKKVRQPNLELVRIVSMLLVITAHLTNHGNLIYYTAYGSASYYIAWFLFGLGFISINLYVLISGYFLVDGHFTTWKLVKMAAQVWFYGFGITMIFWIFGNVDKDVEQLVYGVLPMSSDLYWFASMYAGLYLLSPILNKLIRALTQKQLKCACILGFVLMSVWPNIAYFSAALNTAGGVSIAWFVEVYLIGAYIKLYYTPDFKLTKKILWAIGITVLIPFSRFLIEYLVSTPLGAFGPLDDLLWAYSVFYTYSSILVTISSILVFIVFVNVRIKSKKATSIINTVASCAFGVYLIHDHTYVREWFWNMLNASRWEGKWYYLPACIGTILGVYIVCAVIEFGRQKLFGLWENRPGIRNVCIKVDTWLKAKWN